MGVIKDNKKFERKTEQSQPLNPKVRNADNDKFNVEKEITKKKK